MAVIFSLKLHLDWDFQLIEKLTIFTKKSSMKRVTEQESKYNDIDKMSVLEILTNINNEDKIIATQSYCPHAGGHFSGGWCKNGHLICPIHRYAYDLETGRGAKGQGDYINIYATELREDGLYIGFEESWWSKLWS